MFEIYLDIQHRAVNPDGFWGGVLSQNANTRFRPWIPSKRAAWKSSSMFPGFVFMRAFVTYGSSFIAATDIAFLSWQYKDGIPIHFPFPRFPFLCYPALSHHSTNARQFRHYIPPNPLCMHILSVRECDYFTVGFGEVWGRMEISPSLIKRSEDERTSYKSRWHD